MRDLRRHFGGLALLALAILAGVVLFMVPDILQPPQPPVRIASNQWLGYEPLFLAHDTGALNPKIARISALPSTTEVLRALQHGAADAATLTLDEALTLAATGMPLTVIAVADVSAGADAVLLRSDLRDGTPLRGLRIGYEGTAVGAYVLSRFLNHHTLTLSDITLSVMSPDTHAEALKTGLLDAVVTYEPFISQMTGLARPIFTSAALPGEIVDVLVLRSDRATPERVSHLRHAWTEGVAILQSDNAPRLALAARRHGLTPESLQQALRGIRFPRPTDQAAYLNGAVPPLGRQASDLWAIMTQTGLATTARFPTLPILPWSSDAPRQSLLPPPPPPLNRAKTGEASQ